MKKNGFLEIPKICVGRGVLQFWGV